MIKATAHGVANQNSVGKIVLVDTDTSSTIAFVKELGKKENGVEQEQRSIGLFNQPKLLVRIAR